MLIETVILAILTGYLTGGRLKNLGDTKIDFAWFIFVSLALRYLPVVISFFNDSPFIIEVFAPVLFSLSYLIIIAVLAVNIRHRSLNPVLAGSIMNFIVVIANGGYMPVSSDALERGGFDLSRATGMYLDMNHIISDSDSKLMFLADIFLIPPPYPFPQLLSAGDILMVFGIFIFISVNMNTRKTIHRVRFFTDF